MSAAVALGNLGDRRAMKPLVAALRGPEPRDPRSSRRRRSASSATVVAAGAQDRGQRRRRRHGAHDRARGGAPRGEGEPAPVAVARGAGRGAAAPRLRRSTRACSSPRPMSTCSSTRRPTTRPARWTRPRARSTPTSCARRVVDRCNVDPGRDDRRDRRPAVRPRSAQPRSVGREDGRRARPARSSRSRPSPARDLRRQRQDAVVPLGRREGPGAQGAVRRALPAAHAPRRARERRAGPFDKLVAHLRDRRANS